MMANLQSTSFMQRGCYFAVRALLGLAAGQTESKVCKTAAIDDDYALLATIFALANLVQNLWHDDCVLKIEIGGAFHRARTGFGV